MNLMSALKKTAIVPLFFEKTPFFKGLKALKKNTFVLFLAPLLTLILCGFIFLGPSVHIWPAKLLVADDNPQKADAIILLMGGVVSRGEHAAGLFHKGVAGRLIFAHTKETKSQKMGFSTNDGKATDTLLRLRKVPQENIVYLDSLRVSSTREEALALLSYVKENLPRAKHLVIVTDWYHSQRARWIFERVNQGAFELSLSPAMTNESRPEVWYKFEGAFLATFTEYLKWLYYLIHY